MSYHDNLIDLQKHNLFEIPLENDKSSGELDGIKNLDMIGGGGYSSEVPLSIPNIGTSNDFLKDEYLKDELMNDFEDKFGNTFQPIKMDSQSGGFIENEHDFQINEPLFDKITLDRETPTQNTLDTLNKALESNVPSQTGGFNTNENNFEGMEIEELSDVMTDALVEENGNLDNPDEDVHNPDHNMYEEQPDPSESEFKEPSTWINPELNIENDSEMIVKMNQEDIEIKVGNYIDNYNSEEYQKYLKALQNIYAEGSKEKNAVRRDKDGNIYLIKRTIANLGKAKGKKNREGVQEIITDTDFTKNYLMKITPPEYIFIKDELTKITKELNVLSGDVKLLQKDLIEIGVDISKEDVRTFEKLRAKFYKLINKRYIYTKYYSDINNLFTTEEILPIYANEIVSFIDVNDIKSFKFVSNIINASTNLIETIGINIKANIENYSQIINFESEGNVENNENKKKYNVVITNFLENKKKSEDKIKDELNSLIDFSKPKVNFAIKKLPKIDSKIGEIKVKEQEEKEK